jgi:hypothetical protein
MVPELCARAVTASDRPITKVITDPVQLLFNRDFLEFITFPFLLRFW